MPCSCHLSAVAKNLQLFGGTFLEKGRCLFAKPCLVSNLRFLEIPGIPKNLVLVNLVNRCSKSITSIWCTDEATRLESARLINATKKATLRQVPKTPKMIKKRWYVMIVSTVSYTGKGYAGPSVFGVLQFQCQSPTSVGFPSHCGSCYREWGGWRHWRPGRAGRVCWKMCPTKNFGCKTPKLRMYAGSNSLRQISPCFIFLHQPHTPAPLSPLVQNLFTLTDSMWSHLLVVSIMCCHGLKLQDD